MRLSVCLLAALAAGVVSRAESATADVVLENAAFRLTVGDDAVAKSLVIKANGEECLDNREGLPLFETVQERPFNNETKLAHPLRRMSYPANRIRREGDRLYVGFETAPYTAVVRVRVADGYIAFTLEGFVSDAADERQYGALAMDAPPVAAFRLLQLAVRDRTNFGEWVNAAWDGRAAIGVMGTDPLVDVNSSRHRGRHDLTADLVSGMKLRGGTAAIVAGAGPDAFLGSVERLEDDFDLPRGVASRRDPRLNASVFWVGDLTPANVDRYIGLAKRGGFRMMLIYYKAVCRDHPTDCYGTFGDYDWGEGYPNGVEDLKLVLGKIRAAGITPGFHTLQTHIGLSSRYVTPVADPRLNKKRRFTLAQPIAASGEVGEIAVEENPVDAPRHEKCRVLQFGGELFTYADYTTVRPYRFTGVRRGAHATRSADHARGEIGGVLDVCEYTATSCYIDQRTSLQDEIAAKIARIGDLGMEFYYFDGSEGVNPPCNVNVSLSQFRVAKALARPPLFTQGAAKSHFGWHLQSGGNAFDPFRPEVFKRKLAEHPLKEAPVMRRDFTRIDFGWWAVFVPVADAGNASGRKPTVGSQPDMWEYGTSKAAAWDCPATVQCWMNDVETHPRMDDLLETMRRWEDVRARRWLTSAQKEMLKDPARQFHLYRNGQGEYELHEIEMLTGEDATGLRAFLFERNGRRVIAYWHTFGSGTFALPLGKDGASVELSASGLRYLKTDLPAEAIRKAFGRKGRRPIF